MLESVEGSNFEILKKSVFVSLHRQGIYESNSMKKSNGRLLGFAISTSPAIAFIIVATVYVSYKMPDYTKVIWVVNLLCAASFVIQLIRLLRMNKRDP